MKLSNLFEQFQHYTVKHKPSGKTYKVTAMHSNSAKTKAAVQHGGRSASRYSGTSDDQFEIVEGVANKSIEDCIRKTLEKEGGAAGKGALVDACKKAGYSEEECNNAMSKMSDVKKHEHGDYILDENTKDEVLPKCELCKGKGCDACDNTGEDDGYFGGTKAYQESDDDVEGADYSQDGMIGTPDDYYDAEQRQEAYRDLKDALNSAQNWQQDYIKDGDCPECGGSGYMDGEETFTNDDGEEEESSECYGWSDFGCDEGEMTQRDDGLPNWAEIAKHDERQAEKANRGPAPSKEQIMKLLPMLHKDYVQSGRYNAFELGGILRQMYPELGKRQASSYVADFFSTFSESAIHEGNKGEGDVAKMLSKALGDENRWTEMSPYELYAELESQNPEVADMLAKVAKQLYDVKLKERTYKDVGVADVVKDKHRKKEFKFNKDTKTFQSGDGEEASINTPLGKELMKSRKSQMKKSTPSAHKKKAPNRPSLMSQIFGK